MDIQAMIQSIRIKSYEQRNRQFSQWLARYAEEGRLLETDRQVMAPVASEGKLRITYVMNHVRVCGGAKIVLEQTNQLTARGHQVTIVCHDARPQWMEVRAHYVQVPKQQSLADAIPESDVIVCTVADQVFECYLSQKAPVIHFEQGDVYIYDFEKYESAMQEQYRHLWKLPVPILAVSNALANQLKLNFNRESRILHNALDPRVFHARAEQPASSKRPRILFVGAEQIPFKGVADIRQALELVRQSGRDFEPVWVTQLQPVSPFSGELAVNPTQGHLGDVYRSCDIYVSGSYYESFPLPPLEAMTCGCAVISTRNAGILEYGVDGENCLLTEIGDPQGMAAAIIELLDDVEKRLKLVEGGYQTAKGFTWEQITDQLEGFLYAWVEDWRKQETAQGLNLRIENLPQGLTVIEALDAINHVQMTMEEDWCLWLVEGETLQDADVERIRRILREPIDDQYALKVHYPNDVSEHSLQRLECRLIRRRILFDASFAGEPLPVEIRNGTEGYFLPLWLGKVRSLYREQRYNDIIAVLQTAFAQVSDREQAILIKWLVLALIEQDAFSQAVKLLEDAVKRHATYSDNLYLYARIALLLNENELGKFLMQIAEESGTAYQYEECFADMRSLSSLYLGVKSND